MFSPDDHFYVLWKTSFLLCPWLPELRPGAGPDPSHRGKIPISYAESAVNYSIYIRSKMFLLPMAGFGSICWEQATFQLVWGVFSTREQVKFREWFIPCHGVVRAGISLHIGVKMESWVDQNFSWFGVCLAQGSKASLGNCLFPAMGWVRAGISPHIGVKMESWIDQSFQSFGTDFFPAPWPQEVSVPRGSTCPAPLVPDLCWLNHLGSYTWNKETHGKEFRGL